MRETPGVSKKGKNSPTCPICGMPSAPETKPFCSPRCRMSDLAHWVGAAEPYMIPGEEAVFPEDGELAEHDETTSDAGGGVLPRRRFAAVPDTFARDP